MKMIGQVATAMVLLFTVTGCGDDTSTKSGAAASTSQVAKKVMPKVSVEERKAAFNKQMNILSAVGFDVNQTQNSYVVHVKEPKLATTALLGLMNMATLGPRERKMLEEVLDGATVGIEVDWEKYTANSEQSVEVYFMGNGQESDVLKKIIAEKKIGAYVTFDAKDSIKKVMFKDIDEKIVQGVEVAHILLKGAQIDIKKAATETSPSRAFTIKGGTFNYTLENNGSKELAFSYSDPVCNVDKSNAYLGKQTCTFPLFEINGGAGKDTMTTLFKDTNWIYDVSVHAKKVKADIRFKIPTIDIKIKDGGNDVAMQLKDLTMNGYSDNLDESLLEELYLLATNPTQDINATVTKSMKLVGDMFSKGMVLDYSIGLATLNGTTEKAGKSTAFMMDSYQATFKADFGKAIDGDAKTTIKHISVQEKGAPAQLFDLKNFQFGYAVKDMYNYFPEFMEFAAILGQKQQFGGVVSKVEEEKMSAIGYHIVNHGMKLSIAPVGIDSVAFDVMGQQMAYGKIDFNLDATLAKNDIKFDNPMAAMALLGFLQADGKLVLSKADLDKMSQQFPPQMIAMVMMYAKYEGDKAVFVLKFEKGHLMVNDKPVM